MNVSVLLIMIVVLFASKENQTKSDIVKTEEYIIKETDYVKVNTACLEDILEFKEGGWNKDVQAWATTAGTAISQLLFEENLNDEKMRSLLNYIEGRFSLLRFEKKLGYLEDILDFKMRNDNDFQYRIGPEMIELLTAGGNYQDIFKSKILSEMEHLEWNCQTHGLENEQILTFVNDIRTEFFHLLKIDENYQDIFEALRADLGDSHKMKPSSKKLPFGKVFFINEKNESYALYASGVTRKWTLFKFQKMIKFKKKLLSKSKIHESLKFKMMHMFHKLGNWKKVMEDANVSLNLEKATIYIENDKNEEKIEIERNPMPLEKSKMMHKIKRFKQATRISDEDLKQCTRAAYYEKDWYGFYEIEKIRYKNSTGKYKVTFKDDPNIKFQVHENELFAGDIDVGHEVIVKDPEDEKEDRIGFVTEIVFKGVDPPKIWYNIEWKVPIGKMKSSMVRKTEIVALYSAQKRKREPSPEEKLERGFKN